MEVFWLWAPSVYSPYSGFVGHYQSLGFTQRAPAEAQGPEFHRSYHLVQAIQGKYLNIDFHMRSPLSLSQHIQHFAGSAVTEF